MKNTHKAHKGLLIVASLLLSGFASAYGADQASSAELSKLAKQYLQGDGVLQNFAKAAELYRQAQAQRDEESIAQLNEIIEQYSDHSQIIADTTEKQAWAKR